MPSRAATPADADAISSLLAASYSSLLRPSYDGATLDLALPRMTRANSNLLASGTYYVVECQPSQLIGCGGWTLARPGSEDVTEGEAHIRHFATHPDWVRQGLGTSVLALCFENARHAGVRRLYCYSTLNGEGFYRSAGFGTVGPIAVPMGLDFTFPAMLMLKQLA